MNECITVVYEIVNFSDWAKKNPLKYEHNGLKAVIVRMGDSVTELNELNEKGQPNE